MKNNLQENVTTENPKIAIPQGSRVSYSKLKKVTKKGVAQFSAAFFLVPISVFIFTFLLLPILQTVFYSMTDWSGIGSYHFVGLKNYIDIFHDQSFINSLFRTLFMGIVIAVLANIVGLGLAVLVDQPLKSRNIGRVLFYLPNIIPAVVAAFIWRYILDANNGILNQLLSFIIGHPVHIPFLDSPKYVVYSIILIQTWQMIGPIMIVYIAALQNVPQELLESASIDGASKIRKFFSITMPMIAPGITVNTLIGLGNGLQIFNLPFALTGGGPAESSETMAIKIYNYAFDTVNYTYGMAASFILTIVILIITFLFVGASRKYEEGVQK